MCDHCHNESQPLRVFSPVKVVAERIVQGPPRYLCFPCFKSVLRNYLTLTPSARRPTPEAAGGTTEAPRSESGIKDDVKYPFINTF